MCRVHKIAFVLLVLSGCFTTREFGISQHSSMCLLVFGNEISRDLCGDMEGDKNMLLMIVFNVQIAARCSDKISWLQALYLIKENISQRNVCSRASLSPGQGGVRRVGSPGKDLEQLLSCGNREILTLPLSNKENWDGAGTHTRP